jgi:hypothetical protein
MRRCTVRQLRAYRSGQRDVACVHCNNKQTHTTHHTPHHTTLTSSSARRRRIGVGAKRHRRRVGLDLIGRGQLSRHRCRVRTAYALESQIVRTQLTHCCCCRRVIAHRRPFACRLQSYRRQRSRQDRRPSARTRDWASPSQVRPQCRRRARCTTAAARCRRRTPAQACCRTPAADRCRALAQAAAAGMPHWRQRCRLVAAVCRSRAYNNEATTVAVTLFRRIMKATRIRMHSKQHPPPTTPPAFSEISFEHTKQHSPAIAPTFVPALDT